MTSTKLSKHPLSTPTIPAYDEATRHSFLTEAGNGTLPLPRLALWLSQDRIYAAHAYPRFIGALISRIPFDEADVITSPREQQNQRILQTLVKCLDNIVREVDFFRDTSENFGISMEGWIERKGTRDYTAEMTRVASSGLFEGLVFLWAMEQVYFDAWSHVKKCLDTLSESTSFDAGSGPAVQQFATNWSSPDFKTFVDELAGLVDSFDVRPGTDSWMRAEAIWCRVVELEVEFWPLKGEETLMKKVVVNWFNTQ